MTVWGLVLRNVATLQEIELQWDLADVEDAYELLDLQAETLAFLKAREPKPEE
jgi:hypothetical protein